MDWLNFGIIIGCAVMFAIALVWHRYRERMKADELAREEAQKAIDVAADAARKKSAKGSKRKEKK